MSICGTCGADVRRIKVIQFGTEFKDKCPECAPEEFEGAVQDPSTKKLWIGPEYAPNDYEARDGGLVMKPEAVAELEAKACGIKSVAAQEELEALRKAEAHKREHRRTKPLTQAEIESALAFADRTLRPLIEDQTTSYEV